MSPRMGLDSNIILQAAIEIADTQGLDEVTLASLAQKLGVRSPSLYNHVNGLNDLRKKLAIYGLEQLQSKLTMAAVGLSGDKAVHALGEAYITFARTHPGLYDATLRAPGPLDVDVQQVGSEIVSLILRVLQAYDLEEEAALHTVRGLRSIFHGFASLEQRGGFGLPLNLDTSLHLAIDTFLAGIYKMKK
ncbi:WHG domain-containing protein [Microbacteriaceae bacterium 4G12]